MTKTYRSRLTE